MISYIFFYIISTIIITIINIFISFIIQILSKTFSKIFLKEKKVSPDDDLWSKLVKKNEKMEMGNPRGVVVNLLYCDIIVRKFKP